MKSKKVNHPSFTPAKIAAFKGVYYASPKSGNAISLGHGLEGCYALETFASNEARQAGESTAIEGFARLEDAIAAGDGMTQKWCPVWLADHSNLVSQ